MAPATRGAVILPPPPIERNAEALIERSCGLKPERRGAGSYRDTAEVAPLACWRPRLRFPGIRMRAAIFTTNSRMLISNPAPMFTGSGLS